MSKRNRKSYRLHFKREVNIEKEFKELVKYLHDNFPHNELYGVNLENMKGEMIYFSEN